MRLQNANALTIADQRGVALVSLASIHPTRNEINIRERNGCHAPLIGDYSSTRNRLTRECATLHLSGTVDSFIYKLMCCVTVYYCIFSAHLVLLVVQLFLIIVIIAHLGLVSFHVIGNSSLLCSFWCEVLI